MEMWLPRGSRSSDRGISFLWLFRLWPDVDATFGILQPLLAEMCGLFSVVFCQSALDKSFGYYDGGGRGSPWDRPGQLLVEGGSG